MKWCLPVAALALLFASAQVIAEVGQKPFPKIEGGSGNDPPPVIFSIPPVVPSAQPCAAAIAEAMEAETRKVETSNQTLRKREDFRPLTPQPRSFFEGTVKQLLSAQCGGQDIGLRQYPINIASETKLLNEERSRRAHEWQNMYITQRESSIAMTKLAQCAVQAKAAACGSTPASAQSGDSGVNRPAPAIAAPTTHVPPNTSDNPAANEQQLTKQWREAIRLAQQRQADIDWLRVGKPRLHKGGSVAHHCLKPQPGGGMLNDCPYAIEYHYCVYRPRKDSWSEAFDCEKSRGGAWQVGRGPGTPVLMHMGGEITYWFACRYGETLQKPDGISPADIEFQVGRGLLGRCAEWGSKRG